MQTSRSVLLLTSAALLAGLTACGSGSETDSAVATSGPVIPDPVATITDEVLATQAPRGPIEGRAMLTGQGLVIQSGTASPQFCIGAVATSVPPQCSGPAIYGLDWTEMPDFTEDGQVRWGQARLTGNYDGQAFTLVQPPSVATMPLEPDAGAGSETVENLCPDPFRGQGEGFESLSPDAFRAGQELVDAMNAEPAVIGAYTTGNESVYNVVVFTGADVGALDEQLRQEWPGGLCVATSQAGTQTQVRAAQAALDALEVPEVLASSVSPAGGVNVTVLLDDEPTRAAVNRAVAPTLDPVNITIDAVFTEVQPEPDSD